jgi:hypothetical protein
MQPPKQTRLTHNPEKIRNLLIDVVVDLQRRWSFRKQHGSGAAKRFAVAAVWREMLHNL